MGHPRPIRYVFDTHYHWDHTQGNSVMADQGVIVVCSQGCASELAVKGKTEWDHMSKNAGYSLAPYRLQQPSVVFGDVMAIISERSLSSVQREERCLRAPAAGHRGRRREAYDRFRTARRDFHSRR